MQNIGPIGLLLIVIVALILFGPNKLPQLGRAFGRTLREFKEGTKELINDDDDTGAKGSRKDDATRQHRNEVEGEYSEMKSEKTANERRLPD